MDRAGVQAWVAGYERAWRTPGVAQVEALFAPGATYRTAPFEAPFAGVEAIGRMWRRGRCGPEERFVLESEVVALEGATAVVRLEVRYGEPVRQVYRDLWVLAFGADGRCVAFEEWPFWPPGTDGGFEPGPAA